MVQTADQTAGPDGAEPSTDTLIRSVMVAQKRVNSRNIFPELEPAEEDDAPEQPSPQTARRARTLPKLNIAARKGQKQGRKQDETAPRSSAAPATPLDRLRGYRPTPRHILLAALALVVVMRPWLIPGLVFVTFWVVLIAYLTLGHDRMAEMIVNSWQRFSTRWPDRAEALRRRGAAFAAKYAAFLGRLPESWAEKLALPDLSHSAETDKQFQDMPDPFEKLKLPEVYRG